MSDKYKLLQENPKTADAYLGLNLNFSKLFLEKFNREKLNICLKILFPTED